jgi:hypothetical protein
MQVSSLERGLFFLCFARESFFFISVRCCVEPRRALLFSTCIIGHNFNFRISDVYQPLAPAYVNI